MRKPKGYTLWEILSLLKQQNHTPKDLQSVLGVSSVVVHRYLKELLDGGYVDRVGKVPFVSYRFVQDMRPASIITSPVVNSHFMLVGSGGEVRTGAEAFALWSDRSLKKMSLYDKVRLYEQRMQMLLSLKKNGVYILDEKFSELKSANISSHLREVVCSAVFALPDFGKTKETVLLDIAKSGDKRSLDYIVALLDLFMPDLFQYIEHCQPDAVLFVPPSNKKRDYQIMDLLADRFKQESNLPLVAIEKRHGDVQRYQKNLSSLQERLDNADQSFFVPDQQGAYQKVLLIDDLVGSGATLSVIAGKLVDKGIAESVYGIGIVGVQKGFVVVKSM